MFLKLLIVLGFITGLVVLALTEGRLRWAARQLANDFRFTARQAHSIADWVDDECYSKPLLVFDSEKDERKRAVSEVRLRFLDDTEYVVEAVCTSNSLKPVEIRKGRLAMGTTKSAGSGISIPARYRNNNVDRELPLDGRVLIGSYFRAMEVGYFDDEIDWRAAKPENWHNEGRSAAVASCEGWGLQCCNEITEAGAGTEEVRVLDCRGNCYGECKQRPMILYFNTDPIMDSQERRLNITGGKVPVTFGFEVVDTDSAIRKVWLDFGDGEVYAAKNTQENVMHEYSCITGTCVYQARLTAEDDDNLTMGESRLQEITVVQRVR